MSVDEAASLVIQSAAFAEQAQIYILDMGEKVRIAELAEKMIRLKGLEPGRDIQVMYTGLRAGEKLHEELVTSSERVVATHHPKITLVQGRPSVSRQELVAKIQELLDHPPRSREEIGARLHALARIDLRDSPGDGSPVTEGWKLDVGAERPGDTAVD
jgi:FlaA1/EpsC-like NDP-sugar epimerase